MSSEFNLFPIVREGYRPGTEFETEQSSVDGGSQAQAELDITGDGPEGQTTESASINLSVYGPGEVTAMDTAHVVRMEPEPETTEFPPNYFPLVEFDSPQLPWRYSPERADDQGRNRPWCCLVVVPRRSVEFKPSGTGPLPVLETPTDELPDPDESWAWAHAQHAGSGTPEDDFGTRSERTRSRLLCPRNLSPKTEYRACVVPTFEPGRQAGLGIEPSGGDSMGFAWGDDDSVRLPVYHSWTFTSAQRGDFESLARALDPVEFGPGIGFRTIDVSNPGPEKLKLPYDASTDRATVGVGGALRSMSADPDSYDPDANEDLRDLLNEPADVVSETDYGAVGPPLYGKWHAGVPRLEPKHWDSENYYYPHWFNQLNGDPRHRISAGYGTQVIQTEQEGLMQSAWEQFGDIQKANERLRRLQFGRELLSHRFERFETMSTGSVLAMTYPIHGTTQFQELTIRGETLRSDLPIELASPSFRRLTRSTGPLARRPDVSVATSRFTTKLETGRVPRLTDGLDFTLESIPIEDGTGQAGTTATPGQIDSMGSDLPEGDVTSGGSGLDFPMAEPNLATGAELRGGVAEGLGVRGTVGTEGEFRPPSATLGGVTAPTESGEIAIQTPRVGSPAIGDEGLETIDGAGRGQATDAADQPMMGPGEPPEPEAELPRDVEHTLALLDGVDAHCDEAGGAIEDLERAVRDTDAEEVVALVTTSPTFLDRVESLGRNTFGALDRALGKLLTEPQPETIAPGFDRSAANGRLRRATRHHRDMVRAATAAVAGMEADPPRPEETLRSLRRARDALAEIRTVMSGLRAAIDAGPPLDAESMKFMSMEAGDGLDPEDAGLEGEVLSDIGRFGISNPMMLDIPALQTLREPLTGEIDPRLRAVARAEDLIGHASLRQRDDPVEDVMAHPNFTELGYQLLADLDEEYFLPGKREIPRDSMGVLETNPKFIEAFMVGLNHEMARELRWRRFPTDKKGTYFRRFWNRKGNPAVDSSDPEALADIERIHTWDQNKLGENSTGENEATVVLLIKGELLRRYPNTDIFAAKAVGEEGDRVPALPDTHVTRGGEEDDDDVKWPVFRGTLEPDITFFGFSLTREEALYDPYHKDQQPEPDDHDDEGWFFVLQEPPAETRFGLDVGDTEDVGTVPAEITVDGSSTSVSAGSGQDSGWSALSWAHLIEEGAPEDVTYISVHDSVPGRQSWAVDDSEAADDQDGAEWGYNSAHMARATWVRPLRIPVHADDMIPEEEDENLLYVDYTVDTYGGEL